MGDQHHIPTALSPGKRPGAHCTEGSMGIGAVLEGYGQIQPTGIRSPPLNGQNLILKNRKSSKKFAIGTRVKVFWGYIPLRTRLTLMKRKLFKLALIG